MIHVVYAQGESGVEIARNLMDKINEVILFPLIALMMAIALLVFLYGAFEFVAGANNDSAREKGKRHLLYGLIGLLVMLSAVAILEIAAGTFDVDDNEELQQYVR